MIPGNRAILVAELFANAPTLSPVQVLQITPFTQLSGVICKTWTGLSVGALANSSDPDKTRHLIRICPVCLNMFLELLNTLFLNKI